MDADSLNEAEDLMESSSKDQRIAELTKQDGESRAELIDLQAEYDLQGDTYMDVHDENQRGIKRIAELEAQIIDRNTTIHRVTEKYNDKLTRVQVLTYEVSELKKKWRKLYDSRDKYSGEIKRLEAENAKLKDEVEKHSDSLTIAYMSGKADGRKQNEDTRVSDELLAGCLIALHDTCLIKGDQPWEFCEDVEAIQAKRKELNDDGS
jgi:chromosome segregation ATPase